MKYRSGLYMVNPPEEAKVEVLPPMTGVPRRRASNPGYHGDDREENPHSEDHFPKDLQDNPMAPGSYDRVFKVMKKLRGASKAHADQAEELRQVLKDDWDEEPHSNPPYGPYSSKAPYAASPQSNPGYYEENPHDPHHAAYNPPYHPHSGPQVYRPRGPYDSRALDALIPYVDERDSYHQSAHRLMDSLFDGSPVDHDDIDETIVELRGRYGASDQEVEGIIRLLNTEVRKFADDPDYYLPAENPGHWHDPMDDFVDIPDPVYGEPDMPYDGPDEDDFFIRPAGPLGTRYEISVEGKYLTTVPTRASAEAAMRRWMNENNFFPTAWDVDERGYMGLWQWDNPGLYEENPGLYEENPPMDMPDMGGYLANPGTVRPMSNPQVSQKKKMANLARQMSSAYANLARYVEANPTAEDIEEARFEGIAPGGMFHWQADYFLGVADGMEHASIDPSGVNVHRRVLALQDELKRRGLSFEHDGLNKSVAALFGKYGLRPNPPARMGTSKYRAKKPFGGRTSSGKPRYRKGSGGRFEACVDEMSKRANVDDPEALCASIGRRAYGRKGMAKMAAKGRRRNPPALPYKSDNEDY